MPDPFDLDDYESYRIWRDRILEFHAGERRDPRVELRRLASPTAAELAELAGRIAAFNLAIVAVAPEQIVPAAILAFGRAIGLDTADSNLFADADAVSRISSAGGQDKRGEYIPYTPRPLSWHTDGYYNSDANQVRAWTLFCERPARTGGENHLLDHRIAYIALRDASPDHIAALSHPRTLSIPANVDRGAVIRPESAGPVFSVRDGHLHMRYSARGRHAIWRETDDTRAARAAIDRLFSDCHGYTFTHRLQAGEGVVSNNVLHDRSGFEDGVGAREKRTLYRVRYLDRIRIAARG